LDGGIHEARTRSHHAGRHCLDVGSRRDLQSGEESEGLGKTCYYQCSFGQKATNIGAAQLCPLTDEAEASMVSRPPRDTGGSCMKQGERETGGMTKECIYDCTGSRRVMTIGSAQLCPLTTR